MRFDITDNGDECSFEKQIKTLCEENSCSEFEEKISDLKVLNLANETLQFSFIALEDNDIEYTIFNINEQLIKKGLVAGNKGHNFKTINIPEAKKGFYFLLIEDENSKDVTKFLKL